MADCDTNQTLMPIDLALQHLLDKSQPITSTETLPLSEVCGRILAENIKSAINVPPADNSSMDGYAINSADFSSGDAVALPISQRIPAGTVGTALKPRTVARIFTGAPIPAGADAVVMQEVCVVSGDGDNKTVRITGPIPPNNNIRKAGEDINVGDTLLKAGKKLRPQDVGLAASVGTPTVSVFKRLRVGIFFTGDELREAGETLEEGQIYNSNRYTLRGLLEDLNCDVVDLGTVKDTLNATKSALQKAAKNTDLVMTSGGVSVGEEDYVRIALEEIGKLDLWRIRIKPGKPLAFGHISGTGDIGGIDDTPFLGMPGNPVSVFITFCIFARPFILKKQGASNTKANSYKVAAAFEWPKAGTRDEYIRVNHEKGVLELFPHQGSGVLTSTSWANGLALIPAGITVKANDLIEFIPFTELFS
ncbi:MAG: gephyrin-like molybdotransferase Glp [Cocleimonas sp.]